MVWDRKRTDLGCCACFLFFIFTMVILSLYALVEGKPSVIFTPFDSDGNMCGQKLQTMSNETIKEIRDFTEYKYKFFTNLDSFDADNVKTAFDNPVIYNAICVKECPSKAVAETNETSQENESGGERLLNEERIDCMVNKNVTECPKLSDIEKK